MQYCRIGSLHVLIEPVAVVGKCIQQQVYDGIHLIGIGYSPQIHCMPRDTFLDVLLSFIYHHDLFIVKGD